MKINSLKKLCAALLVALILTFSAQTPALAEESAAQNITLTVGSSTMQVGDKEISIADGVPILQNDRIYVPLRAVAEAFGAEVDYDSKSRDVTILCGETTVIMNTLASVYTVNSALKWMDVAPYINSSSRTMVPIRFVSDALGYSVENSTNEKGDSVVTISR